jgi:peptide/nickel transport system permease protein
MRDAATGTAATHQERGEPVPHASQVARHAPRRWPRSTAFWLGAAIAAVAVLAAVFAPLLAPYPPLEQDVLNRFAGPSPAHPLGLDELGRDILSRLLYGGRITLITAVLAVAYAAPLGCALGALAGFSRGWVDTLISRGLDVLLAFPTTLLALVLIASLGPSSRAVVLALGIAYTPLFTRIVRGAVFGESARDYVRAAEALGQRRRWIVLRHIGPNVAGIIVIQVSFAISGAMMAESSLSFLGLGVSPADPSWGRMLSNGAQIVYIAPHIAIAPIVVLSTVILGFFLLGEGLREWLDPRRRGR